MDVNYHLNHHQYNKIYGKFYNQTKDIKSLCCPKKCDCEIECHFLKKNNFIINTLNINSRLKSNFIENDLFNNNICLKKVISKYKVDCNFLKKTNKVINILNINARLKKHPI